MLTISQNLCAGLDVECLSDSQLKLRSLESRPMGGHHMRLPSPWPGQSVMTESMVAAVCVFVIFWYIVPGMRP